MFFVQFENFQRTGRETLRKNFDNLWIEIYEIDWVILQTEVDIYREK